MKQKMVSWLLAASLLFSVNSAFAAKKDYSSEQGLPNIYTWGAMDTEKEVSKITFSNATGGFSESGGVDGSGCVKTNVTGIYGSLVIPAPLVAGETYDISFDFKADADPAKLTFFIYFKDGGYQFISTSSRFTREWSHFSMTWTNNGLTETDKKQTSGAGTFNIRYNDGNGNITYYIDNFSIIPHGEVHADYSSLELPKEANEVKKDENAPVDVLEKTFSDVENHWAKDTVNTLATYGFVDGVGDGLFLPDAWVTRAQFIKMAVDSFSMIPPAYDGAFSDVSAEAWYAGYITLANSLGLLPPAMTLGGKIQPDVPITREEAATIASRVAERKHVERKENAGAFSDEKDISDWAKQSVKLAADYGFIRGYEDGTYLPKAQITRGESAQILLRMLETNRRFLVFVDSENGSDQADGTQDAPVKSIFAAQEIIRKFNKTMANDIKVKIRGEQYLDKTFALTEQDSGSNGFRVIYTSWGTEKPTLSMGKHYTGFTLHDVEKNIYKTYVGGGTAARQAYFNNERRVRANNMFGLTNPSIDEENKCYYSEDAHLLNLAYPKEVELVYFVTWMNPRLSLEEVADMGNGKVKVVPNQEKFSIVPDACRHSMEESWFPAYLENAYEFLDTPGEWYLNPHDGYMYYIPLKSEDMSHMRLTLPVGEKMITAMGTSSKTPIRNIVFENIEFANTAWNAPTNDRFVGTQQNNMYGGNNVKAVMPRVAVSVQNAHYVDFTNSKFTRMGCIGLAYEKAVKYCDVIGNEFCDIAGGAMFMGSSADEYLSETKADLNEFNRVNNNYLHNIATDYQGSAAISTGFPQHSEINHNEIANLPYSGIHVGWGWTITAKTGTDLMDLEIAHNHIREVQNGRVYDGACIYTVTPSMLNGPMNSIHSNYLLNNRNAYGAIYIDNGSTRWDVTKNVVDHEDITLWELSPTSKQNKMTKEKIRYVNINTGAGEATKVHENYTTTNLYATTFWDYVEVGENYSYPDADWPEEVYPIIAQAGIEPAYEANFDIENERSFVGRFKSYTVDKNGTEPLDLKIVDSEMKEYPLSDYEIYYYSSNPALLTVDENGVMHAHGDTYGNVSVYAVANINGVIQMRHAYVTVNDSVEKLELNANAFNMVSGYSTVITATATTASGQRLSVMTDDMTFRSENPAVAMVERNGSVTAVGAGETVIHVTATYKGKEIQVDVPVRIINYSQEDSERLPYENAPASMFYAGGWSKGGEKTTLGFAASGSPNYLQEKLTDKLIAFDMTINKPGSWPSLAICASGTDKTYENGDVYLIGFKTDHIELQRFNEGVRTMIFGAATFNPIGGPGVPNPKEKPLYEYGKTYSIVVGALSHADGTRLVLTINGKNAFDYIDTDEKAIPADGYFGVYIPGDFTFSPFTGKTNQ